ncbi:hypothetical protein ACLKA6_019053 [Drosophila palustris]
MDINLSLEHHEALYKAALAAQEHAHYAPKCVRNVEELQQRCRICGCLDDGTFVELDAVQDFEFESSICSYRVLFQRTSLQFQFHTMPDLPSRICIRCGYKAKIFYLLTRQFVLGQHAMRSTITDWYHKKYGVEAPEQIEDRARLMNELAMTMPETNLNKETPQKCKTTVKELIKDCEKELIMPELKRSISADNSLDAECAKIQSDPETDSTTAAQVMTRSTVNLRCSAPKTARAEMPKTEKNREKTVIIKECLVTPRVAKIEARGNGVGNGGERLLNKAKTQETTVAVAVAGAVAVAEGTTKSEKTQMQQKLQERRRQWR